MRHLRMGWLRNRKLRRGGMVMSLVSMSALTVLVSVEVDSGRLYVAAHRDQIVSDAMTMAAAQHVYDVDQATASAVTVKSLYASELGTTLNYTLTFYPTGADIPTSVKVSVTESVPTFFQAVTGTNYTTAAPAAATRAIPSALTQGAVPIGVQYDQDFDLPADGKASETVVTLKLGSSDKKKGNTYALDFDSSAGASDWSKWLSYGYTSRIAVGDVIKSKTGTMSGPTADALVNDANSRLNRAANAPYDEDTYDNFHPGNPRIVIFPLVDWQNSKGGSANLEVKGFAAFWIESYNDNSKQISGRFVRAVTTGSWPGVSVDTTSSDAFDGGFWEATISD